MPTPTSALSDRTQALAFGRCEWRPVQRQLLIDGRPAALARRAAAVLAALIERRERAVPKNELLDLVWPDLAVEEGNLYVHINSLRKLLGPEHITTVPGRGYRFTAPLMAAGASERLAADIALPEGPERLGNMPPLSGAPMIGRQEELESLVMLAHEHRLISILGPPGVGKTRLALALGAHLQATDPQTFSDGVWLVEAANLEDGTQLPRALTQALNLEPVGVHGLARQLSSRRLLIVMDNCEHVLTAAAALVEELLHSAPGVRLVATSQEALHLGGERLFKVHPLAVPARGAPVDLTAGAIRLFTERAQAAIPGFAPEGRDAEVVAEICRQLDGLPLAIELAAARVALLGLAGVRDRLSTQLHILKGGRGRLPRHKTLRQAIDWSYSLLSAEERRVFRRLGTFVGGFSLEVAQLVVADREIDRWAVLDHLGALVEKSLVIADAGEPPRYRLLESMRAFALERTAAGGETADSFTRHAKGLYELLSDAGIKGELPYVAVARPELDNVRSALDRSAAAEDWPTAVALAGVSAGAFSLEGLNSEIVARLRALAHRVGSDVLPAQSELFWRHLTLVGFGARLPMAEVISYAQRGLGSARATGSPERIHCSLFLLASAKARGYFFDDALKFVSEMESLGDVDSTALARWRSIYLQRLILIKQGRLEDGLAKTVEEEAWLLERLPLRTNSLLTCRMNQCATLNALGRYELAAQLARGVLATPGLPVDSGFELELVEALVGLHRLDEALAVAREKRAHWTLSPVLADGALTLSLLAAARGRHLAALRIHAAWRAHLAETGRTPDPQELVMSNRLRERFAASGFDRADQDRLMEVGTPLDEAAVVALALDD